jgi:hypothetical protein
MNAASSNPNMGVTTYTIMYNVDVSTIDGKMLDQMKANIASTAVPGRLAGFVITM